MTDATTPTILTGMARQRAELKACIRARVSVMFWGQPGVGKTDVAEQVAAELQAGFVAISGATCSPEDAGGIPIPPQHPGEGIMREPLGWLVRANQLAASRPGGCVILIDEFSNMSPACRASFLSLVQSRYAGDIRMHPRVTFVGAANPTSQAADGWDLDPATISRWVHRSWEPPSVEEWTEWLLGQSAPDGIPQADWSWSCGLVAGYLSRARSALCATKMPEPTRDGRPSPYPCPRSWANATKLLAMARQDVVLAESLVEGAIGHGTAIEFSSWVRDADLPDPEALLKNPASWSVPKGRADRALATLLGVSGAVVAKPTQTRYEAAVDLWCTGARAGLAGAVAVASSTLLRKRDEKSPVEGLKTPPRIAELSAVSVAAAALVRE